MSPEEAKEWGLIDEIVEQPGQAGRCLSLTTRPGDAGRQRQFGIVTHPDAGLVFLDRRQR